MGNILILRGDIEVLPRTRQNVSYEFLSQLVAEYLLTSSPDVDISAALSIMPYTQRGMDLNPVFTAADSFHPSGSAGGELKLFEQVNIPLLHGWLVDPDSTEAPVLKRIQDYDTAVTLIAEADHLTNGRFVVDDSTVLSTSPGDTASPHREWTAEELQKVQDATVVRRFLDSTQSQLTYHGLFYLAKFLPPNQPCALFRNSHLSVLYKHSPLAANSSNLPPIAGSSSSASYLNHAHHDEDAALYTLVTDQVFLNEPSVVWERLEDVDGGWSTFVDSDFVKSSPAGGDFAGQTAEEALRAFEAMQNQDNGIIDPVDLALARQLQAEEQEVAQRERTLRMWQKQQRDLQRQQQAEQQAAAERERQEKKEKKKKDCIIM
ncbi:Ubiquitin carboxyl-terminal hydrolase MINDY-1 [Psilocybe cubensis]|uniref:Ubiquitin carboxyl-terminal hydrolase MINDY-1 n=1 Tax=Psilocybe cubensis TaxID=181762 RepID=A0ACB8GHD1_PSICU|nr:Ubiquitin carboxyl-terminal hydrolase MINDY-1 [Psilocybe cubensis]KAH9474470.1 Ubiquitin carboxyl-terminal hydrolase MINDY-1 [Psilocybe cubensis]